MNTQHEQALHLTHHALVRCKERRIDPFLLELVFEYGDLRIRLEDGRQKIVFTNKMRKHLPNGFPKEIIKRLLGLTIILAETAVVVTAYKEAFC